MNRIFEKIERLPSDKKRIFSLIIAFILTALVVTIWLLIDKYFIKDDGVRDLKAEQGLSDLKNSFQDVFKSAGAIPEILSSSTLEKLNATSSGQQ